MKTQFALSLLGLVVSGLALLIVAVRIGLRKYRKQPVSIPAGVALGVILVGIGVFSGYKFLQASYHIAVQAVEKTSDVGRELISRAVNFGTVSVLEGFGKTSDHFNEKWRRETLADVKCLELSVLSSQVTANGDQTSMRVVLGVKNTAAKPIDFNDIIERQHILLKDSKGMCYPLEQVDYDNSALPAGETSVRQIDITLPDGLSPALLVTPVQEVSLQEKP